MIPKPTNQYLLEIRQLHELRHDDIHLLLHVMLEVVIHDNDAADGNNMRGELLHVEI